MKIGITELYYMIDEFCKMYEIQLQKGLLHSDKKRHRSGKMSLSERLTIMIYYHLSGYKCFKYFYTQVICGNYQKEFPEVISYSRFIQLVPTLLFPLSLIIHALKGEKTGTYFMDATSLQVCHNKRIQRNKTFEGLAQRGKSSMGWFYGFKLHMVINNLGQIMAVRITAGNTDDRIPVPAITKDLQGVVVADKGYISKKLFEDMYKKGLRILTGIRKNMKNMFLSKEDKALIRKRFMIETKFHILKNIMNINHTRHRSPFHFLVNTLSALVGYQITHPDRPISKPLIQN
jgi:hypothetical protein